MKRMKFDMEMDETMRLTRQKQWDRVSKDPRIRKFLEKNSLDRKGMERSLSAFCLWLDELDNCKGCTSIARCRQKFPGRVLDMRVCDGQLEQSYRLCRFGQEEDRKHQHNRQFLQFHGTDSDLETDIRSIDPAGESREYANVVYQAMLHQNGPEGLYLYGQPGTGKTFLSMAIANEAAKAGRTVCFVKVPRLMQLYKESLSDPEYRQRLGRDLRLCDLLVLDDIGAESITPWTRDEILLPLLDERMQRGRQTWFTSNYDPGELQEKYSRDDRVAGLRILERIKTLAKAVELKGPSRRN